MRGDRGNHYEELGHKSISYASQYTIPGTAGTTRDPVGKNSHVRSSTLNQASPTPEITCPLVFSISFTSCSTSLFLEHHRRTPCSVIPLFLSMPC
jgi:hypothetical protein